MHKSQHVPEMLIIKNIYDPLFDVEKVELIYSFVMEEVTRNGEMLTFIQQMKN